MERKTAEQDEKNVQKNARCVSKEQEKKKGETSEEDDVQCPGTTTTKQKHDTMECPRQPTTKPIRIEKNQNTNKD